MCFRTFQLESCSSENCDCDLASSWRNGQIASPYLEDLEFEDFHGADHEVDILKLISRSALVLKRMTIKQSDEVPPSDRGCQELRSILEANASVECNWV